MKKDDDWRSDITPGDVNRTQSNSIVDRINQTRSNPIKLIGGIDRTQSKWSIEQSNWSIEQSNWSIEQSKSIKVGKKCKSSIGFDWLRSSNQSLRMTLIGFDWFDQLFRLIRPIISIDLTNYFNWFDQYILIGFDWVRFVLFPSSWGHETWVYKKILSSS